MRKIIVIVILLAAVLFGGFVGYRWYETRKQDHLLKLARQFLEKSEGQNALLTLQLLLRSSPNNLEAVRMVANLTDAIHSPSALAWRKRVVQLNPNSLEDRLSLVQTAILLRDYNSATNALAAASAENKKTAAYQNVAGTVAEAAGQMAEAEAHFTEAARLEPTNQAVQLNLAMVHLHGANPALKAEARTALGRIAVDPGNPALQCVALRQLTMDAKDAKQFSTALALSKQLVQQPGATFGDQLLRLDLLKKMGDAELKPALAKTRRDAVDDAGEINALATWQMANTTLDDTLAWLRTLPLSLQTNQPTALLIAQCLTFKQDWAGLQNSIQKQNWAALEFTRHAFLSRAMRELGLTATSETEWQQALKLAGNQQPNLVLLLRLAGQWKWDSKAEDILWTIVNKYPGEQWANKALEQALFATGRTRPLMMLYGQQLNWNPADLSAQNNQAWCALLLDAQELKPFDSAAGVYQKVPNNPNFAATYAFALHTQKKDAAALKVMESLKPQDLQKTSVAGYYGLVLKATGNPAKARTFLDLALKSTLLPEERKLFEQARAGI